MLVPKDDLRHPLADHALARESLYWNLLLPEQRLAVIAYLWVTKSAAGRLVTAFGPEPEPVALEVRDGCPLEGADFDHCRVAGLEVRMPKLLTTSELSYKGERIALEYHFAAAHEAFDYARNPGGCPLPLGQNRFEQAGLVEGMVSVDGRELSFSTTAERDHSWGTRDWQAMHHYKWISAQAGPDISLNAMLTFWRGETLVNGFVFRNGGLAAIIDARAEVDFDSDLHHRSVRLELRDEAGRLTVARGERFAGLKLPLGGVLIVESACRFVIEDVPGVGIVEVLWPEGYLEHLKAAST